MGHHLYSHRVCKPWHAVHTSSYGHREPPTYLQHRWVPLCIEKSELGCVRVGRQTIHSGPAFVKVTCHTLFASLCAFNTITIDSYIEYQLTPNLPQFEPNGDIGALW